MLRPSASSMNTRIGFRLPIRPKPSARSRIGYSTRNATNRPNSARLRVWTSSPVHRWAVVDGAAVAGAPATAPAADRWTAAGSSAIGSGSLGGRFAKQTGRLEDQRQDQHPEHDRLGPARIDQVITPGRDDADQQPADEGTVQVADPAEHGGGERQQAVAKALEVPDLGVVGAVDQAGRAGQRSTDQERQRDRLVDVDAHHRGGFA